MTSLFLTRFMVSTESGHGEHNTFRSQVVPARSARDAAVEMLQRERRRGVAVHKVVVESRDGVEFETSDAEKLLREADTVSLEAIRRRAMQVLDGAFEPDAEELRSALLDIVGAIDGEVRL